MTDSIPYCFSNDFFQFFQIPIVPIVVSSYKNFLSNKDKLFESGKALFLLKKAHKSSIVMDYEYVLCIGTYSL